MQSNHCEEFFTKEDISKKHEEELSTMDIPKWANVDCPFCKEKLPLNSIRSIAIKTNAANIGDIAVEICCTKCRIMDTVYFRREVTCMHDFIGLLDPDLFNSPQTKPITEEEMYKSKEHNLFILLNEKGGKNVTL